MKRSRRYALVAVVWVAAEAAWCHQIYEFTLAGR